MKVSELTGALLDYWVAQADPDYDHVRWERQGETWIGFGTIGSSPEFPAYIITSASTLRDRFALQDKYARCAFYEPSKNWSQGGPLIERWRSHPQMEGMNWNAIMLCDAPLRAICRAVVRARFGDEVPDEEAK